jgi:alkanesulfonate monooxygenase SsuD/methylene tetrahydromethanopterin reductase-like flavin-dependent oxidoreductase (luciferase family)
VLPIPAPNMGSEQSMELGIFAQGYVPKFRVDADPDAEHHVLLNELGHVQAADRAGLKYAWVSEHHFLEEYSHISSSEIFISYALATTKNIHVGAGIFNPLPKVNHPAKVAERVAMLDHYSDGRFEFGVGRGAGTHEVTGFGIESTEATRAIFEEVVPEFAKMWRSTSYSHNSENFVIPPRNVLPKMWKKPHPPMWQAAGNPATWEMAARKGLGILGFSMTGAGGMGESIEVYKKAIAKAEPVGDYINDNVMLAGGTCVCLEDGKRARQELLKAMPHYQISLVYHYHDTFPRPDGIPYWPELLPPIDAEALEAMIAADMVICGDPDEVNAQMKRIEASGCDLLVMTTFTTPNEIALETIETLGKHVNPVIDRDPVHRSSRFRDAAAAKLHA